MPPMACNLKSLEELQQLCAEIQQTERARRETSTVITVGMGTCGIAAGARETLQAIQEELARRQIDAHGRHGRLHRRLRPRAAGGHPAGGPEPHRVRQRPAGDGAAA